MELLIGLKYTRLLPVIPIKLNKHTNANGLTTHVERLRPCLASFGTL